MTTSAVELRLRLFCRMLAVLMSLGAVVELLLVDHTGTLLRWLPFGLCAVTAGSVGIVSFRPTRPAVRIHRLLMLLVMVGSAYGVYAHLSYNMTFAREIRPSAPAGEIWTAGVCGANPLLAAGVLAAAAALGFAGTYGVVAPTVESS